MAEKLRLQYAVDFPMMVRDELPLDPAGNPDAVRVQRIVTVGEGSVRHRLPRQNALRG
jgi:hypothetical protein